MKRTAIFSTSTFRYTLFGVLMGCLFPLLGMLFAVWVNHLPSGWKDFVEMQRDQPLLWIIDTAPLFLGFAFGVAGNREDSLTRIKLHLEQTVSERTAQLLGEVDDRKRVEEALAGEKTLLRTLIDNLPDRIYIMDAQGRKLVSNQADWQASGGKAMEDVIGKTDFDLYPAGLAKDYWAVDKAVIDSGKTITNFEEPGLDSQGNPVTVLTSKVPLFDPKGKIIGLVGIGHDITDQKQVEQALAASESELRALFSSMHDVVMVIDRDGVYRKIAPTNPGLLVRPPVELLGKNLRDFFPPEQAESLLQSVKQVLKTKQSAQTEYQLIIDEKVTWFQATITEMNAENTLWVARDVTDQKRAEDELVREKEFLSALNLNSPVSIVVLDEQ
jgi:PAS domain S-box-containing protein